MDCKGFEGLLIDFIEDEIEDPSEREAVKKHLLTCPYCSREVEEYKEIRRMLSEEALPKPSSEVLVRLSKAAKEEVKKDESPFWRRWFYSPVLIPLLSSALVLFIWVSYGKKVTDLFPSGEGVYPRVATSENPLGEKGTPSPGVAQGVLGGLRSESSGVLNKPSPLAPEVETGLKASEEPSSKGIPVAKSQKEAGKTSSQFEDRGEATKETAGTGKKSAGGEFVALKSPEVGDEAKKDEETGGGESYSYLEERYRARLNLALKEQSEGKCVDSIKTNEELLRESPPPPLTIKVRAYLSLAECYEKEGKWDRAITSYRNLEGLAPERSTFVEERIEGIRWKTALLKARELEFGNKGEGQKAE